MQSRTNLNSSVISFFLVLLAAFCFATQTQVSAATPGSLDPTFQGTGFVQTASAPPKSGTASALALQPDGKIVTTGGEGVVDESSVALTYRYLPDGTLDTTFGGTGGVRTGLPGLLVGAGSVAIQSDGKIVIAGSASSNFPVVEMLFLARYNTDGSLDTTFNGTGIVTITLGTAATSFLSSIAVQPDGKIVGAGYSFTSPAYDFTLVRFNTNGTLDTSFNGTGFTITQVGSADDFATSLALQSDGKLVAAGYARGTTNYDFAVVRYNSDGTLDTTFNGTGQVVTPLGNLNDIIRSVAIQADGKIVGAGQCAVTAQQFCLARFNPNGSLDASFNGTGKLIAPIGSESTAASVKGQSNGKLLVAGGTRQSSQNGAFLARYNSNGTLDTSFRGGIVSLFMQAGSSASSLVLQPDGKAVITGTAFDASSPARGSVTVARYFTAAPIPSFDFDADAKTDVSIFRPSVGQWYILKSHDGLYGVGFGATGDKIAPADYDGDGKTDVAVYRPSNNVWYVLNSSNSTVSYYVFGAAEDLPTPADYDGDGKADLSVFRPSTGTWYRLNSADGSFFGYQFGQTGDKPAVGDFDGDGKADISIFRPTDGSWYRVNSSNGQLAGTQFGAVGDLMTAADYDGDGKTDIAVFRPSVAAWYRLNSSDGSFAAVSFGAANDIPAPGDYDGDGKADVNVFRPSDGNWYRLNSSNNAFVAQPFGANGDLPTPAVFRY